MANKLNGQTGIYNIINKEKLDVVNKPISEAHGLPNECYNNAEYTKIERKKLFEDKWVVIGVASSIPNIGDIKPFDLLGIPLLLVRNKKDQIKVFHNICSHRGSKLVTELCKRKNIIRCPYHSWSYNLDGDLIATPHIGGMNKHKSPGFKNSKRVVLMADIPLSKTAQSSALSQRQRRFSRISKFGLLILL